jgi:hypothetical protein
LAFFYCNFPSELELTRRVDIPLTFRPLPRRAGIMKEER